MFRKLAIFLCALCELCGDNSFSSRVKGKLLFVHELRPGTHIEDDSIPMLLSRQNQPTFITNNVSDFWRRVSADRRYCILCFVLPNERQSDIPQLLRRLLALPPFKTKSARMGKVARVSESGIQFYLPDEDLVHVAAWD